MDPRLRALADAAEREQPVPDVCLLVDGWLVRGTPVSSRRFLGLTHSNMNHAARSALDTRGDKALRSQMNEDQIWRFLSEQTASLLAAIDPPIHGSDEGLNLSPVVLTGAFGTIETTGIRIPITAINGWWIGSFRQTAHRASGGGIFVDF